MEKIDIIDYYEDLEHIIDLKCELLLFNCDRQSSLYNNLNESREKLINSIHHVSKQALSSSQSIFGFLLMPEYRHILHFKFIITNKKISNNVQTSLNLDREELLDEYEKIEYFLLKKLIDQRPNAEEIIDLRDNSNNIIEELSMQVDHLGEHVCLALDLINKQKIKNLGLTRLKWVDEDQLAKLVCELSSLEELTLAFYKNFQLNLKQINQLQKLKSFNFNLSIDTVKNIDIKTLGQIDKIDQLRIQESSLFDLDNLDCFKSVKYLCLNWNNIEHVSKQTFAQLSGLIALDIGGNEIKNLDEHLFQNLANLEFLNLRHNYINQIDTKCLNYAENLQFLSLINGYYDSHDELSVDFDSLFLPKLKYMAIRCNKVPILKNFRLEFLEIKGLKDKKFENLKFQSHLKGLKLVFSYETNFMPQIDKSIFESFAHLVYLAFRFDYIFDAEFVVENKMFYKGLIRQEEQVNFYHNLDEFSYQHCLFAFVVSIYTNIVNFVIKELNFSKHALSAACDYHEIFYQNFFNNNFD